MPSRIAICPPDSPYRTERMPSLGKIQLQKSLSKISDCNIVFKALSFVMGWAVYLPISEEAIDQMASTRSVVKLCSSTFSIPKFLNKSIELYEDVKELACCVRLKRECPNSSADIGEAVSVVFFSTVEMINKSIKVVCCLDKTKIIDLAMIAEGIPEHLDKICCATNLLISSHRFISTVNKYYHLDPASVEQSQSLQMEAESRKHRLMVKMASNAFKVFSSIVVGVSIFFPALVSPVFAMGLSTVSFLFTLGGSIYRSSEGENISRSAINSRSIYYLNA
ncbi:MAG: hypothetical protein JSR39_04635 [Verrucomicrobia bacterium]|nr:hypothetical protein [Verrucomicrobiota bacterium]